MPHSVAPINAAVCNKARSPLGDRQCERTNTNLESGGIYYIYARSRKRGIMGSCPKA